MTIPVTTVTGPVVNPYGSSLAGHAAATQSASSYIVFTPTYWDQEAGGSVIIQEPQIVSLDVDGQFSVDLFRTTSGENNTYYQVHAKFWDAVNAKYVVARLGQIATDGAGPVTLQSLLAIPTPEVTSPDVLAQCAAYAAAAEVAAGKYATRAELVEWVSGGGTALDGTTITAGGYSYIAVSGSTMIADLNGWEPVAPRTPFHFGAVGDEVTDDLAPLREAVATAGHVLINETFALSGRLQPVPDVRISGDGGLKAIGDATFSAIEARAGQDRVWVDGITLDGDTANRAATGGSGILSLDTDRNRFTNVKSINWPNAGVLLEGADHTVVEGCEFLDNEGVNLSMHSSPNSSVRDNFFEGAGKENLTIDNFSHFSKVTGNTFGAYRGGCGNIGWDASDDVQFTGNLVDSGSTTDPSASNRVGVCLNAVAGTMARAIISMNTIINNDTAGIHFRDRTGTGGYLGGSGIIETNTFENNGTDILLDGLSAETIVAHNLYGSTSSTALSVSAGSKDFLSVPLVAETGDLTGSIYLEGDSTAGTATYSVRRFTYQKVGDTITFECYMSWTGHTGVGQMFLRGLPAYTKDGNAAEIPVLASNMTVTGTVWASMFDGGGAFRFYTLNNGSKANLNVPESGSISFTGSYKVEV